MTSTTTASGGMNLIGVNISGGEFGSNVPGTMGSDYIYPSDQEIDYYASQGMTVIRMPFLAERLENNPNGSLSQQDLSQLQSVVSYAATKGIDVDLDMHNYGTVWGQEILPGSSTEQAYDNLWGQLATAFKSDPNVIFGLMNEPNTQTPSQQATIDNDAIAAIRQTGANQEVLVPGTDWTGGWTWVSSGNAAAINPQTIQDPDNNWAVEVHQYLDSDGSGTHFDPITDPNIGAERLTAVTQWAQQNGVKLFLGETGVPSDGQSLTALQNMLSYMESNSSVWQGVAYWAGGQWWGSYPMSIEPTGLGTGNVQNAPQMGVLSQFAPGGDLATGYGSSGASGGNSGGSSSSGGSAGSSGSGSSGGSSGGGSSSGSSFTPSPNDTVITAGSSGSITDANGNVWTITSSNTVDENGSAAGYTANVAEMAYANGNVWHENTSGNWYEWNGSGGWNQGSDPLPTGSSSGSSGSTTSPNDTVVQAGSNGSITDSSGNVWTITSSDTVDENGSGAGYTANVAEIAYVNNNIWHENTSGNWYEWNGSGGWNQGSDPLPASSSSSGGGSSGGGSAGSGSTPSPNDTAIQAASGGSITDANGNVWTITSAGTIDMNGAPAGYSANVIELAYVNGNVWQENSSDLWWQWQNNTWQPGAGTSQSPLPANSDNAVAGTGILTVPAGAAVAQGATAAVPGIQINDPASGNITLNIQDSADPLIINGNSYAAGTSIPISGSEAQLNADLATLGVVGSNADQITLNASDQSGVQQQETIPVSTFQPSSAMSFIYNTGSAETAPAPSSSLPITYEVDSGGSGVLTVSNFRFGTDSLELGAGVTITSQAFSGGAIDQQLSNQGQVVLYHS